MKELIYIYIYTGKSSYSQKNDIQITNNGSLVVKALGYKPNGSGFETR
jgi:hypothetical protein